MAQQTDPIQEVREIRLWGDLPRARAIAERHLAAGSADAALQVGLRLELARIHDRIGLHFNQRPVAAAMVQVDSAAALREVPPGLLTAILLMRAELQYRAASSAAEYGPALLLARRAAEEFRRLEDRHGEAEATHLIGLVHLQRQELKRARTFFEQSLELDRSAGARAFFMGEYERHIGFVELLEGDTIKAIPHLERSLALRRQVGARDASLFAANTLAAQLVAVGRLDDARRCVLYAMTVAAGLDAPLPRAQLGLVVGALHASTGDLDAARMAFEHAIAVAEPIGASGIVRRAREGLAALGAGR